MREAEGSCRIVEESEGESLFFGGERERKKSSVERSLALVNGWRTRKGSVVSL